MSKHSLSFVSLKEDKKKRNKKKKEIKKIKNNKGKRKIALMSVHLYLFVTA
jgi:hypothetical protein